MKLWKSFAIVICLLTSTLAAYAQKNEFAVEGSGSFAFSQYSADAGYGFQVNYARRFVAVPLVSVYGEIPFVASYNNTRYFFNNLAHEKFNDYYLTPGVRVKFAPGFFISPYLAAGVGWGHFSSKDTSATDNEFAADFGAGFDVKLAPFVGLRFEARDFYSDSPVLALPSTGGHQNNVVASGGIVLRF